MIINGLRFQDRFPQMKKFSQLARGGKTPFSPVLKGVTDQPLIPSSYRLTTFKPVKGILRAFPYRTIPWATLVDNLEPCYYCPHGTRLDPTSNIKNSIPGGTDSNGCRKVVGVLGEERRCY